MSKVDSLNKIKSLMESQDPVNHPQHYQSEYGLECWQAILAALGGEGYINYCKGNVMKYLWREKNDPLEDAKKAKWYLESLIEEMENERERSAQG